MTGQTSASYNMRLNYERCLLEFEHYLASGQYSTELAANEAPSADVVQQPARAAGRELSMPPGSDMMGTATRRCRDLTMDFLLKTWLHHSNLQHHSAVFLSEHEGLAAV